MKISAMFASADHAEIAARNVSEAGVVIGTRRVVTPEARRDGPHLPTDAFYFPAAAEFYTGMATPVNVVTPGMSFYPMAGHVEGTIPEGGEARLELDVRMSDVPRVRDVLLGMHGTNIQCDS